ncbi:MAG: family 20 glycosylhydrolase [Verrucomicrobia bacterium]|nr:family 20 glycosylhydrolase [Verrucomicrobiota bacterium]
MTSLPPRRGVHFRVLRDSLAQQLIDEIPNLARRGVNVIVVEIDYSFEFARPENRPYCYKEEGKDAVSQHRAEALVRQARENGIRLIPEFNCLGHQGINTSIYPLLALNPDFDETPGYPNIPTRAWCPRHPGVMPVVLGLIDEIIDVFQADAIHVGMEEVLEISSPLCPRGCMHYHPAELFAGVVMDLHTHIVWRRGLEMLMWGDRLLDIRYQPGANVHDASANWTHRAISLIPTKQVVICDWHYNLPPGNPRDRYPSIQRFLDHGFKVWPTCGTQPSSAKPFSDYSRCMREQNPDVLGFLCTTWNVIAFPGAADTSPIKEIIPDWKEPESRE